jgi:hypothetical protein
MIGGVNCRHTAHQGHEEESRHSRPQERPKERVRINMYSGSGRGDIQRAHREPAGGGTVGQSICGV